MGYRTNMLIAIAILGVGPVAASGQVSVAGPIDRTVQVVEPVHGAPGDWIVEEADNVCGLTDARQLRTPAAVDYDALVEVTSEWKEMKRKGIDKDSPEGQVLFNKAVDRVRTAASTHMKAKGYDSVWKEIKHRRGLKAPDVTDEVKALVQKGGGGAGQRG